MTDTESQLRAILKAHAADSEHLLDALLHEQALVDGCRIETLERHLSALREAAGPFVEWGRTFDQSGQLDAGPVIASNGKRVTLGQVRALLAAHDAAPATPSCTCWQQQDLENDTPCPSCRELIARQSAPTLTLEEVEACFRETLGPAQGSHLLDGLLRRAKERLAQKGAGRGK